MTKTYGPNQLTPGDIVEFPDNQPEWRFGVALGGFGMHLQTIGSKIFGIFGATKEEAIANYNDALKRTARETDDLWKKIAAMMELDESVDYGGWTRRQDCRIVGRIDIKTGDVTSS